MALFHPDNSTLSNRHKELYALHELAYTAVDFAAAVLFVVGSVLFFWEATTFAATWLFLVGSVLFGVRPTIKLARELRYAQMGAPEKIARD